MNTMLLRCKKCKQLVAEHQRPTIPGANEAMAILMNTEKTRHERKCNGDLAWAEPDK